MVCIWPGPYCRHCAAPLTAHALPALVLVLARRDAHGQSAAWPLARGPTTPTWRINRPQRYGRAPPCWHGGRAAGGGPARGAGRGRNEPNERIMASRTWGSHRTVSFVAPRRVFVPEAQHRGIWPWPPVCGPSFAFGVSLANTGPIYGPLRFSSTGDLLGI